MSNPSWFFIGIVLLTSCISDNTSESREVRFYEDGNIEFECALQDSLRNGICKGFYPNGHIKFYGEYRNGLRHGHHYEYYANDSGKVQYEVEYRITDDADRIVASRSYNEQGLITYETKFVNGDLKILGLDSVAQYDSAKIEVEILNPKFDFFRVYTGDVDKNLGVVNEKNINHFVGYDGITAILVSTEKSGWNKIKGFAVDFAIVPLKDSIYVGMTGVEKGESIYFEHEYYVIPQLEI